MCMRTLFYKKITKPARQILASDWAQTHFLFSIRDKHSNESWNWFAKSSIPWALPPVLKIFRRLFADLTDSPWVSDDGWRPTELSLLLKFQFVLRDNNNNANLIFIVFSFNKFNYNCAWPLDKLSHLPDFFREKGYFALLITFFSTKADRCF